MDTLLCNDDGDIIFFGAPSATDEILAFHYGNFDNAYGDGTVGAAASNGRVYADTVPGTLPAKFGSIGTPTTASGQTTYTWTPPATSLQANVLVVAGGGGGGGRSGGGGGGGGLIYQPNQTLNSASYTIVVGQGGTGGAGSGTFGTNGKNSSALSFTAIGGGGGASDPGAGTGLAGGSGGGGRYGGGGGTGTTGQGNNGGGSTGASTYNGGGGGGAGSIGETGTTTKIGDGGAGFLASVYGENYGESGWFAGGGGGGSHNPWPGSASLGGIGGGGAGGTNAGGGTPGGNGDAHTGGGGGAGSTDSSSGGAGGSGGSGVVLVRYIVDTAVITNEETLAFLYTGSGTETTYTWDAEGVTYADILVVGGGGAGRSSSGYAPAGGGGGGEVVYRQGVPVTPGVEIKVGCGGPVATQGGISQFTSSIRANGGGSGGSGSGGSGGGANRNVTTGGASVKLGGGMGNVGGVSISGVRGAAGGGGATQPGFNVTGGSGSNGGEGYAATVFGVWNTVYGSGGGGGDRSGTFGLGGTNAGNGGKHDAADKSGTPGVAHTGSGGGGAGAENGGGTGGLGGSGIVLVKPNPGALDGLGSSVYTQAVGAYALRRLFGAYTGAQVRLRRSTDNVETDVYFDKYGYPVNFDMKTWLEGGTGYVVTWYDQGPNATHTTGYGTTLPSIYDRGGGGTYAIYFPGTSTTAGGYFDAGSVTLNIATNGGVSTFSRVNFLTADSAERVYDYGNGAGSYNLYFVRNSTTTNTILALRENTTNKTYVASSVINNSTWQSFGNRIQGSGSSWIFMTRADGTENTSGTQTITYTDRTITNSYIGRPNWSTDPYSNMYLACQIFFNTGSITSEQFGVMENVLY
jgi:hypothetical protein